MVIHKCHGMKVLLSPWLIHNEPSKSCLLGQLEVIVVEDCYNMQEIMGSDEDSSPFRIFDELRVLVLKKLPNLKSIYSGTLLCDSLEEITVGDCPQLTRIPIAIAPSLKKIEVDPKSLLIGVEECDGMVEIVGTDGEWGTHQSIVDIEGFGIEEITKFEWGTHQSIVSIYSGRLLCNSLEEITVGDCPQLTRIPFTASHSLKKI